MADARKELFLSVLDGDEDEFAALLNKGVDPDVADPNIGYTSMHIACATGRVSMLKRLLKSGASVDAQTIKDVTQDSKVFDWYGPTGSTPLMIAVQRDQEDCVRLLIRYGASASLNDIKDMSAKKYAKNKSQALAATLQDELDARSRKKKLKKLAEQDKKNAAEAEQKALREQEAFNSDAGSPLSPQAQASLKVLELVMSQMSVFAGLAVDLKKNSKEDHKHLEKLMIGNFQDLQQTRDALITKICPYLPGKKGPN